MNRNIKEEIMYQYEYGWNMANVDTEDMEDTMIAELIGSYCKLKQAIEEHYIGRPINVSTNTPFQRAYLAALKSRFVRMQGE